MKDFYNEIEYRCSSLIDYLSALYPEETLETLGSLHELLQKAMNTQMELRYQKVKTEPIDRLCAHSVTLEFKDEKTKRLYRRSLPLDYEENNNGIVLSGENFEGAASSLAFLSNTAAQKMVELTGKGWEKPRCKHEEP